MRKGPQSGFFNRDEDFIVRWAHPLYVSKQLIKKVRQTTMDTTQTILQLIVALGLLNVWLLRTDKQTPYRGKGAENMRAEFEAYGLPVWFMWVTGALKIGVAAALIAGIWVPVLVQPAAIVLILLMLGAFAMHLKVKDPFQAAIPALAMLFMAVAIALL